MQEQRTRVIDVSLAARLTSSLVRCYVRYCPIRRGKWRFMQIASRFLVVRLAPDVFIRIQGMSNVEMAIAQEGIFESETVKFFLELLAPGMTVLDVGANVGQYTLLAAGRVGPRGEVHAFEPTSHVASKLRLNVRLNGFGNVTVCEKAVSDSCGEASLYYVEDDGENNILAPEPGYPTSVKVQTITLDEYVRSKSIDTVDVIKMDIEGAELKALRGAPRLLSGNRAPILFVEVNPRTLGFGNTGAADLIECLREYGYQVWSVATYGTNTHDPWTNAIAFKPTHQERWPVLRDHGFQPLVVT